MLGTIGSAVLTFFYTNGQTNRLAKYITVQWEPENSGIREQILDLIVMTLNCLMNLRHGNVECIIYRPI